MRVIFTQEARRDLADIARYIAVDNPDRARSYVEKLRSACLEIGQMPNAFELVEDTFPGKLTIPLPAAHARLSPKAHAPSGPCVFRH